MNNSFLSYLTEAVRRDGSNAVARAYSEYRSHKVKPEPKGCFGEVEKHMIEEAFLRSEFIKAARTDFSKEYEPFFVELRKIIDGVSDVHEKISLICELVMAESLFCQRLQNEAVKYIDEIIKEER